MKIIKNLLLLATLVTGTENLQAQAAFQASLTPDIAIHAKTTRINGLTLSIWGENPQDSLSLGFVNGSAGDSSGLSWGWVNYAEGYTGVAWGIINVSQTRFLGWQAGAVNFSQGSFRGLQSGFINVAEKCHGLQFGAINYAENLRGLQIGFVNVAANNPWFTAMPDQLATGFPIVNWSF